MRFLRGLVSFQGTVSRLKLFLIAPPITFLILFVLFVELALTALSFDYCSICIGTSGKAQLMSNGHIIGAVTGIIYFLLLFYLCRVFYMFRKPRGLSVWPLYVMGVSFAVFHVSKWQLFYIHANSCRTDCDHPFYKSGYEPIKIDTFLAYDINNISFLSFFLFLLLLLILSAFKR